VKNASDGGESIDNVITELKEQERIFANLSGKMILRMPDGWVSESDLERLHIPLSVLRKSIPGLH